MIKFILLFLALISPIAAVEKADVTLQAELKPNIVIYSGDVYGYSVAGKLVKYNKYGHLIWDIRNPTDQEEIYQIKFNRLFMMSSTGNVEVVESEYGFHSWSKQGENVAQLSVGYPSVFYAKKDGAIGNWDFFTGQPLWETKNGNYSKLFHLPRRNVLVGVGQGRLDYFSAMSGTKVDSSKISNTIKHWDVGWGMVPLFELEDGLYKVTRKKKQKLLDGDQLHATNVIYRNRHYVSVDKKQSTWSSINLISKKENWKKDLPKLEGSWKSFLGEDQMLLISPDFNAHVYSYDDGEEIETYIISEDAANAILNFQVFDEKLCVITAKKFLFFGIEKENELKDDFYGNRPVD